LDLPIELWLGVFEFFCESIDFSKSTDVKKLLQLMRHPMITSCLNRYIPFMGGTTFDKLGKCMELKERLGFRSMHVFFDRPFARFGIDLCRYRTKVGGICQVNPSIGYSVLFDVNENRYIIPSLNIMLFRAVIRVDGWHLPWLLIFEANGDIKISMNDNTNEFKALQIVNMFLPHGHIIRSCSSECREVKEFLDSTPRNLKVSYGIYCPIHPNDMKPGRRRYELVDVFCDEVTLKTTGDDIGYIPKWRSESRSRMHDGIAGQ
jgi:hypothetical protein